MDSAPQGRGSPERNGTSPLPRSLMSETEESENPVRKTQNTQNISNHYEVPNLSSMLYDYTNAE